MESSPSLNLRKTLRKEPTFGSGCMAPMEPTAPEPPPGLLGSGRTRFDAFWISGSSISYVPIILNELSEASTGNKRWHMT